jgi:hypothetical protein
LLDFTFYLGDIEYSFYDNTGIQARGGTADKEDKICNKPCKSFGKEML